MSSDRPIMSLSGVSKGYKVADSSQAGRRGFGRTRRNQWFTAVDDVSFDVHPGEVIGLVGANGAGKSTVLKLMSRVAVPDKGSVTLNGPVMSLLEVGAGFHPELTARENVYLNGAILGMDRAAVNARFDEIVALAGVGRFLDTPVKRFSSGMRVRLAIAVGLHLDSEAIILDEVLAVGDADFQHRCLGILDGMATDGQRATLLVSHNMTTIREVCRRVLVMHQGKLVFDGSPDGAVSEYFSRLAGGAARSGTDLSARTNAHGDGHLRLLGVALVDDRGDPMTPVARSPLGVAVELSLAGIDHLVELTLEFCTSDGRLIATATHGVDLRELLTPGAGDVSVTWSVPQLPFSAGQYSLNLSLRHEDGSLLDSLDRALPFPVTDPLRQPGALAAGLGAPQVVLEGSWSS